MLRKFPPDSSSVSGLAWRSFKLRERGLACGGAASVLRRLCWGTGSPQSCFVACSAGQTFGLVIQAANTSPYQTVSKNKYMKEERIFLLCR